MSPRFLALFWCLACGGDESATPSPPAAVKEAPRDSSAPVPLVPSVVTSDLSFLPAPAAAALREHVPAFELADSNQYPAAFRDSAARSDDERLVFVRGDLQAAGTIDFVVTGRGPMGPCTVALLQQKDGAYRSVFVIAGPERADTLKGVPAVIMQLRRHRVGSRNPTEIVITHLGEARDTRSEHWVWVPGEGRFMLAEGG